MLVICCVGTCVLYSCSSLKNWFLISDIAFLLKMCFEENVQCLTFEVKNLQLARKDNNLGPDIHIDFEKSYENSTFHFPLFTEF